MKRVISNTFYFSVLYFLVLGIDIFTKHYYNTFPYRYISKPLVIALLIVFYLVNQKETSRKDFKYMLGALLFFLVGDLLLIPYGMSIYFVLGMLLFVFGKLCFAFRFSHQSDFKLNRLAPFLIACFIYIYMIMNYIYDNLGSLFIPVLLYFFASIIVLLLGFLRKGAVNKISYILVFAGVLSSIVSDTISSLSIFYNPDIAYEKITVMLFYGISQYLIVLGIVKEVKVEENLNKVNQ